MMTNSLFPQRRGDGSFSVAVRYMLADSAAERALRQAVASWIQRKEEADHVDVGGEFVLPPRVEVVDRSCVQVVFDCPRNAVLWKGLMVELVRELDGIGRVRRTGFWDLVTGLPHPASIVDAV
jgi:hypothetical protein